MSESHLPHAGTSRQSRLSARDRERELQALLASIPGDRQHLEQLCAQTSDWPSLFSCAGRHGVEGVLYSDLRDLDGLLPPQVQQKAREQLAFERLAQSRLVAALDEALERFHAVGVRAVVLKGPLLGERLYGDPTLRPASDLDLLVVPGELDAATDALRAIGYEADQQATESYFARHHHHVHFGRPHAPPLELHFRLSSGFGVVLAANEFVARAKPFRTARGGIAWVLAAEDEFLYLCLHAAQHYYQRLGWLYDLKLFLRAHPGLDWPLVFSRARALGVASAVSFGLRVLRKRLHVMPKTAEDDAWGRRVRFFLAGLSLSVASGPASPLLGVPGRLAFHALLCDRPAPAFRLLQQRLLVRPRLWLHRAWS